MATVFQRGIDGQLRQDYGPRCVRCHTVGWNEKTKNDGFDDVAIEVGWDFPQRLALGNSRSLPSKLEDRANVGCEACHGAGRFYTSYSSEVCALCHDAAPDYVNPREWRLAPMSTLREGTTEKATCRRCHTVQGFLDEYYGHRPVELTARPGDAQFEAEPVTCPACHDVHQGQLTRLVRGGGSLVGQNPDVSWGTGMVCLFCHHGGSQWVFPDAPVLRPFVPREINIVRPFKVSLWNRRLAPHAPQADMIRGRAGHALPGPGLVDLASPHLSVPGGCVGCHVRQRPAPGDGRLGLVGGHTFAMFHGEGEDRVENTDACAPCHGQLSSLSRPVHYDYDGNGRIEGIYEEVNGLLERTHRAVQKAITDLGLSDGGRRGVDVGEYDGRVVVVDEEGNYLGRPPRPMTIPDGQERLYRAVYNYLTVVKDRSKGVHNPVWTVRILQRTAKRLNPEDIPQWDWR
jgi:hypothetical protein